jgi:hypothetical protein
MRLWDYVYTIRNNALIFDMYVHVIQHKRNVFWIANTICVFADMPFLALLFCCCEFVPLLNSQAT